MKILIFSLVCGGLLACSSCMQIVTEDNEGNYSLPVVQTTKGTVQGSVVLTDKGNLGYAFQGVPFAATTGGANRFKPPAARDPWDDVLNATHYAPKCWQALSLLDQLLNSSSSEDCLTINIYTPVQNLSADPANLTLYPVIYYVFGGAWQSGDPGMYHVEPFIDNFASRDVIIIFVNYRNNVFAGFTTNATNAPGNLGMRDMIAGLQWVQDEITSFGGDPDQVTIQGESSGGQAVSFLTLSPLTEGLFHQSVPMSGSGVAPNALQSGSEVDAFYQLAGTLGCNNFGQWFWDQESVITCMQDIDPAQLTIAFALSGQTDAANPRIDGPGGLFPEEGMKLADKRRPYNLLTGTTAKESVFFLGKLSLNDSIIGFNSTGTISLCDTLAASKYPDESTFVADACKKYYNLEQLKQDHPDSDNLFWFEKTVNLTNANEFFSAAFSEVDSMRKAGAESVFLYSFDYVKKGLEGLAPWHAMDLWHIFGLPAAIQGVDLSNKTEEDLQIDEILSTIYCNFAKHGNPTPPAPNGTNETVSTTSSSFESTTASESTSISTESTTESIILSTSQQTARNKTNTTTTEHETTELASKSTEEPTTTESNMTTDAGNSSENNTTTLVLPTWEPLASPIGYNYYSINLGPENKAYYHYEDVVFWDDIAPFLASAEAQTNQNQNNFPNNWPFNRGPFGPNGRWPFNRGPFNNNNNGRNGNNPFGGNNNPFGRDGFNPFGDNNNPFGRRNGFNPFGGNNNPFGRRNGFNPFGNNNNPFGRNGFNPFNRNNGRNQRNFIADQLLEQYQNDKKMTDFIQQTVAKTAENQAKPKPSFYLASNVVVSQSAAANSTSSGSTTAVWLVVGSLVGIVGLAGAAMFVNLRRRRRNAISGENQALSNGAKFEENSVFSRVTYDSIE